MMWTQYYKERVGGEVVESIYGFMAYRIFGEECFIDECFVCPEYRNDGEAKSLLKEVEEKAKSEGCKYVTSSVSLATKNATDSLAAALACGFKLNGSVNGLIGLKKEI